MFKSKERKQQEQTRQLLEEARETPGFNQYLVDAGLSAGPLPSPEEEVDRFVDFQAREQLQPDLEEYLRSGFVAVFDESLPNFSGVQNEIRDSLRRLSMERGKLARLQELWGEFEVLRGRLEEAREDFKVEFGSFPEDIKDRLRDIQNALAGKNEAQMKRVKEFYSIPTAAGIMHRVAGLEVDLEDEETRLGRVVKERVKNLELIQVDCERMRKDILTLVDAGNRIFDRLRTEANAKFVSIEGGFYLGAATIDQAEKGQEVFRRVSAVSRSGGINLETASEYAPRKTDFELKFENFIKRHFEQLVEAPREYDTMGQFMTGLKIFLGKELGRHKGIKTLLFIETTLTTLASDPTIPAKNRQVLKWVVDAIKKGEIEVPQR